MHATSYMFQSTQIWIRWPAVRMGLLAGQVNLHAFFPAPKISTASPSQEIYLMGGRAGGTSLTAKPPHPFHPVPSVTRMRLCCYPPKALYWSLSVSFSPAAVSPTPSFPILHGPFAQSRFSPLTASFYLAHDDAQGLDQVMAQPSHLVSAAKSSRSRGASLVGKRWSTCSVRFLSDAPHSSLEFKGRPCLSCIS
ncbi:Kinetochore protein mis14 [Fusarium oxysporum f. sp. albedinis]|nr:Kinetochore protein mis14 [Fusarium oxysporum f. sp. albedinis]